MKELAYLLAQFELIDGLEEYKDLDINIPVIWGKGEYISHVDYWAGGMNTYPLECVPVPKWATLIWQQGISLTPKELAQYYSGHQETGVNTALLAQYRREILGVWKEAISYLVYTGNKEQPGLSTIPVLKEQPVDGLDFSYFGAMTLCSRLLEDNPKITNILVGGQDFDTINAIVNEKTIKITNLDEKLLGGKKVIAYCKEDLLLKIPASPERVLTAPDQEKGLVTTLFRACVSSLIIKTGENILYLV